MTEEDIDNEVEEQKGARMLAAFIFIAPVVLAIIVGVSKLVN